MDGVRADIGYALDPVPVANETGAWATAFTDAGEYCKKKLITEGAYSITVTDAEYNTLAVTAVAFYDAGKPVEEQPGWAKLFVK